MAISAFQAYLLTLIKGPVTDEVCLWPDQQWRIGRPPIVPRPDNQPPVTPDMLELIQMGAVETQTVHGVYTARITLVGRTLLASRTEQRKAG